MGKPFFNDQASFVGDLIFRQWISSFSWRILGDLVLDIVCYDVLVITFIKKNTQEEWGTNPTIKELLTW